MTASTPADRRWFRRLILIIVGLVLLAAIPLAIRSHGISRYRAAVAEWRAAGEPDDEAGILARQPASDLALLERWIAWEDTVQSDPRLDRLDDLPDFPTDDPQAYPPGEPLPAEIASILADAEPALADGLALLDQPGLDLSSASYRQVYLNDGGNEPLYKTFTLPMLLTTRYLAMSLQWQSLASAHELPLTRLNALCEALSHPDTLIDSMILVAIESLREQTFLFHARRGTNDPPALRHWLDTAPDLLTPLAGILRNEVAIFAIPASDAYIAGEDIFGSYLGTTAIPESLRPALIYLFAGHDSAAAIRHTYCAEACLQISPPDFAAIGDAPDFWTHEPFFNSPLPQIETIRQNDASNRHARITAYLIRRCRQGHPLPTTAAELPAVCQGLLAGDHPLAAELVYEAVTPSSFRCRLAPGVQHAGSFDRTVVVRPTASRSP